MTSVRARVCWVSARRGGHTRSLTGPRETSRRVRRPPVAGQESVLTLRSRKAARRSMAAASSATVWVGLQSRCGVTVGASGVVLDVVGGRPRWWCGGGSSERSAAEIRFIPIKGRLTRRHYRRFGRARLARPATRPTSNNVRPTSMTTRVAPLPGSRRAVSRAMATPQATKASERDLLLMPPTLMLASECRGHLLPLPGPSDVPGQVPQPQRASGNRHDLPRLPPPRPHHPRARRR